MLDAAAIGVSVFRGDFDTAGSVMFLLGIGEILEEEESAAVSREEAEKKILKEAGKGYEIERLGLEKYQDNMYWAARVVKGGEARQIWIDAEAGETFLNQKE